MLNGGLHKGGLFVERRGRMLKIAVCDDESFFREQAGAALEEYSRQRGIEFQIEYFSSGEELLQANCSEYGLFCLDVEMKDGISGLEVAQTLRRNRIFSEIIFVTNHQEEAYRAFEVSALRYLLKPIKLEQLFRTMDLIMKRREERERRLIVLNQGQKFLQVVCDNIIYCETIDRKLQVYTTQKTYLVDNKINEVDKQLSNRNFFRVHKSYLINLAYVQEHDQTTVTMLNGDVVYVSRLKLKAFKESFLAYLRKEHKLGAG
ncbi:MAG TPA: hypothetical protein DCW90_07895 [Lachnospiraceae bacterium]|nr:hypothetical protein [Lachnospiraceae bacterium]